MDLLCKTHTRQRHAPLFGNLAHKNPDRKSIKRFHIQPRHSAHSLTNTTATHPRGKLVNYKRLACYEHCPGTIGYTFVQRHTATLSSAVPYRLSPGVVKSDCVDTKTKKKFTNRFKENVCIIWYYLPLDCVANCFRKITYFLSLFPYLIIFWIHSHLR